MVLRLLENSFMSLSISCFISGGRLANSSELMSTEFGFSYSSSWDTVSSFQMLVIKHGNNGKSNEANITGKKEQ